MNEVRFYCTSKPFPKQVSPLWKEKYRQAVFRIPSRRYGFAECKNLWTLAQRAFFGACCTSCSCCAVAERLRQLDGRGGGRLFILFYFSYLFLIESLYVMYLFRADAISKTVKYFQYGRTLSQKKLTGSAKDRQKCRSYYGSGFI